MFMLEGLLVGLFAVLYDELYDELYADLQFFRHYNGFVFFSSPQTEKFFCLRKVLNSLILLKNASQSLTPHSKGGTAHN